jgi:hypothetical protein
VPARGDWRVALGVFLAVLLLYELTFAAIPTGNGQWMLFDLERGGKLTLLPDGNNVVLFPDWPLTGLVLVGLVHSVAAPTGWPTPLQVMQIANAVAGAVGAAAFGQTIVVLGGGAVLGVLGALVLATSFASWFSANADTHHLAFGAVLVLFYLFVRRLLSGLPYGRRYIGGIAAANALVGLLLRASVLFGVGAVAAGFVRRPRRRAIREALVYVAVGALITVVLFVLVGIIVADTWHPRVLAEWFRNNVRNAFESQEAYEPGGLARGLLKLVKAQLTALLYGTQALSDAFREPALFGRAKVLALIALAAVGYATLAALAIDVWRAWERVRERWLAVLVLCAGWWLALKLVVNWWFWPGVAKYHLQSLPPLLIVLMLGAIATRATPGGDPRRRRWQLALVVVLLAVVATGNFWGAMLPYYRYGRLDQSLRLWMKTEVRRDDLFVSAEAALDPLIPDERRHVDLKNVFAKTSKEEGFRAVREQIAAEVAEGRRVFVYNLVPSPYTLFQINHQRQRRPGERFSPGDFEAFEADLRARYALQPVLTYWEAGREPLYLFGERMQTVWRLARPA